MTQDLLSLFDCDEATLTRRVADALKGADDGELFVEYASSRNR
jgi:TldD protein